MAAITMDQETTRCTARAWCWFKAIPEKFVSKIMDAASEGKKLGVEDPRRIIHSLKVGLAISLVSLFYYFDPLYEGFGVSAMWAVMTVVVVFEFSVGATLGRGVNRGIATLFAGSLGVGAHRLASFPGEKIEPILLGLSVFSVAAAVTFIRFYPKLKARYDYGLLIFILTFCLISVSGYRDDEVLEMAHERLSTILIGGAAALIVCVLICPIWAGEDLHNLVAGNIENLGTFLEGFGCEYFQTLDDKLQDQKASLDGYKSVLNSKSTEESLANFAKWEPRHGRFRYRHPWDQYLKIGMLVRECAYRVDALSGYLNSEMKTPPEVRVKIQELCTKMSSESSLALKELSLAIKTMSSSSIADPHIVNAKTAAKKLKSLLKTDLWKDTNFLDIIPAAAVSSLLIEIVSCTVKIADSVHELASMAKFNNDALKQKEKGQVLRVPSIEGSHNIAISVE
ncbi:aluminum-activated malate transporter 2-like [Olea europaea var. sylvestris]|uniref:aluminum-activated malate transporter 2-like n=1 Tax=Olea europaea var. sylvestris TaxID=158386 RepID=UPI000C1D0E92|nr:aluminum-activated malate transporter 2-like [Olea europaea var. sylvestris]